MRGNMEQENRRHAEVIQRYRERFGDLPPSLYSAGPALPLYIELMEQALQGKRPKITESDLGYPPGADV